MTLPVPAFERHPRGSGSSHDQGNVDLARRRVLIEHQLQRIDEKMALKTDKSLRTLSLVGRSLEACSRAR